MKTYNKDNYLLITVEETTIDSLKKQLEIISDQLSQKNIILVIDENSIFKNKNFSLLLSMLTVYYNSQYSFIIVNKHVNLNNYTENHTITPTIEEAIDVLELEEIERDLLK